MYRDIDMGGNADPQPLVGSRRSVLRLLWMIAVGIVLFGVVAFLQRGDDRGGPTVEPSSLRAPVATGA